MPSSPPLTRRLATTSRAVTPATAAVAAASLPRWDLSEVIAAPRRLRSRASPATRPQSHPAGLRCESIPIPVAISRRPTRRKSPRQLRTPIMRSTERGAANAAKPKPMLNHPKPRANFSSFEILILPIAFLLESIHEAHERKPKQPDCGRTVHEAGFKLQRVVGFASSRRKLRPRDDGGMGGNKPKVQLGVSRHRRRRRARGDPRGRHGNVPLSRHRKMDQGIYFEVRTTTMPLATGRSPWHGSFRIWFIQMEAEAPPSRFIPCVQSSFFTM